MARHANKPRQWKSILTHRGWFNLLIYATFLPSLLFAYLFISVPRNVTLLPPPRSLDPRLGLGDTWVRQLRSGSCHYPTAATKCNVGRHANKPRQLKSMLTHQGWFNLLIYATFTRTTNYRVCYFTYLQFSYLFIFPCSAPSQCIYLVLLLKIFAEYFPVIEMLSRATFAGFIEYS